jgi:uncharacterized protein YidB (DUF937 family)
MDLMKIGTQMLMSKISGGNGSNAASALAGLLGGKSGDASTPDIGGLIAKMQGNDTGNDITDLATSWLGKGENATPSIDQLKNLFGGDKIAQFASALGTDEATAVSGLQEALPNMVDQASPEGNLLDSFGGLGGLASMASKLLK